MTSGTRRESASNEDQARRQEWLSILAQASPKAVAEAVRAVTPQPSYKLLRAPECGMIMLRGRAGGSGRRFNLGEATVTRCSVKVDGGSVGHGYVLGRSPQHAEQTALLDALLQDPSRHQDLWDAVIAPLAQARAAEKDSNARKTAATKVDFFTMVRGESE